MKIRILNIMKSCLYSVSNNGIDNYENEYKDANDFGVDNENTATAIVNTTAITNDDINQNNDNNNFFFLNLLKQFHISRLKVII